MRKAGQYSLISLMSKAHLMKHFKNRENPLITATDGKQYYHSRSVAVVAALLLQAQEEVFVALVKRGTLEGYDAGGLWCLPCGYLDWDESGEEAILREVWEEIGLDLTTIPEEFSSKFLHSPWKVQTSPRSNRQNVSLIYGAFWKHSAKELPQLMSMGVHGEIDQARWVKLSEINKLDFAFHHNQLIEEFYTHVKKEI